MKASTAKGLQVDLPVMEAFYTLQGEGFHVGTPAYFIRLGGCDVGCHWCDVKESWTASDHPSKSVDEIVEESLASGAKRVVITGGEPLMYDLTELTAELKAAGLQTHLETSGVYPLTGTWDWVCFSPKKFKAPLDIYYQESHELKVVVFNRSDFSWAQSHAVKMHEKCQLFVQPEWSRENENLPALIQFVKENQDWRISLQTHKYMNIP